ncbi:MAG: hypothetical protein WBM99_12200 [Psychromonas sp.]
MGRRSVVIKVKGLIFSWLLRLLRRTWRVHIEGIERLDRMHADNKRILFCFWHGKYVPIFPIMDGYQACVITNQSNRGNVIDQICRNFGYQSVQIPVQPRHKSLPIIENRSSKTRVDGSLRLIKKALSGADAGAFAVDGPLGPRHRVKSGVIRIASGLGFDLLPISVDCRRKIMFHKRWDLMEIPLPFTKVCLVIGEPIKVHPDLRSGQLKTLADELAEAILLIDKQAENMVLNNDNETEIAENYDR